MLKNSQETIFKHFSKLVIFNQTIRSKPLLHQRFQGFR